MGDGDAFQSLPKPLDIPFSCGVGILPARSMVGETGARWAGETAIPQESKPREE